MGEEDEEASYKAMDELIEVVSCKTSAYYRKLQSGYIQHFLGNFLKDVGIFRGTSWASSWQLP